MECYRTHCKKCGVKLDKNNRETEDLCYKCYNKSITEDFKDE